MKKLTAIVLALALTLSLSATAFAVETETEGNTEVEITTSIAPTYTVTIPANTDVAFNATTTNFGKVELTAAQLDPGYAVQVSLEADGTLNNQADNTKTIAYTISTTQGAFTSAQYLKAGESTSLTIDIAQEAWDNAYAGEYSDTVIFTVSYVKTNP